MSGRQGDQKLCAPCSEMDESLLLGKGEVCEFLAASNSLWSIDSSEQVSMLLTRKFVAKNFESALRCINEVASIAERESHHPDFHLTNYREVQIDIWTHKLRGITQNDLNLAKMIDIEVKIEYSPKWLRENPSAGGTSK